MSLAISTASSSVSYGMITSTGPKISSCAIVMSVVTLEKTVGLHEEALLEPLGRLGAAGHERGALVDALLDVAAHALALHLGHQRAERRAARRTDRRPCTPRPPRVASSSTSARRDRGTIIRVERAARLARVGVARRPRRPAPSSRSRRRRACTFGDLPPSSSATRLIVGGRELGDAPPARVEPVNDTMSTSGCAASASPTTGPSPVTRLNTPGGKPSVVDDLGEDERVDRRDLGRLQHDGAAGGQRVGDLGADLVERVVPRRDAADDADRLLARSARRESSSNSKVDASSDGVAGTRRCRCPPGSRPRAGFGMPTSWVITSAISSRARLELLGDPQQAACRARAAGVSDQPGTRPSPRRRRGRCRPACRRGWSRRPPRWWSR